MGKHPTKRKKYKWISFLMTLLAVFGLFNTPVVYAAQQLGAIRLNCSVSQDGQTTPLAGDTYAIVQVASIDVQNQNGVVSLHYKTCEAFSDFDCDWEYLSDSQLQVKAKELEKYAQQQNLLTSEKSTDTNGAIEFSNLATGLYLVSRTTIAPDNQEYHSQPFLISLPTAVGDDFQYVVTVSPKFQSRIVAIRPADMTVYMGGNNGYDQIEGGQSSNSLPKPMFVIQAPPDVDVEQMTLEDTITQNKWQPVLIGQDEQGNNCYRLDKCQDTTKNIEIRYVTPDGISLEQDEFSPQLENELFVQYQTEIPDADTNSLVAVYNSHIYPIQAGTGTLTVRGVEDHSIDGNPTNPVTDLVWNGDDIDSLEPDVAVAVAPEGTRYTLNNTNIMMMDLHGSDGWPSIGLLFDDIINDVYDREDALKQITDEQLPQLEAGETRYYQCKYLDLVDMDEANLWVKSTQPVEIYWGYPEGTDQNTEFSLWHFPGLHRDGTENPEESGYDLTDIYAVEPEGISIENTPEGIKFTAQPGGFSPFVLVWQEKSTPTTHLINLLPQTGDQSIIFVCAIVFTMAVIAFVVIAIYQRKKRNRK